jgi:hypothetical protein
LLLQAELHAKRRELEELMRKDQGQTSSINQDVCSDISADKSEAPGTTVAECSKNTFSLFFSRITQLFKYSGAE